MFGWATVTGGVGFVCWSLVWFGGVVFCLVWCFVCGVFLVVGVGFFGVFVWLCLWCGVFLGLGLGFFVWVSLCVVCVDVCFFGWGCVFV